MKIFVDENVPSMTVRALREMSYDVLDIRGTAKQETNHEKNQSNEQCPHGEIVHYNNTVHLINWNGHAIFAVIVITCWRYRKAWKGKS